MLIFLLLLFLSAFGISPRPPPLDISIATTSTMATTATITTTTTITKLHHNHLHHITHYHHTTPQSPSPYHPLSPHYTTLHHNHFHHITHNHHTTPHCSGLHSGAWRQTHPEHPDRQEDSRAHSHRFRSGLRAGLEPAHPGDCALQTHQGLGRWHGSGWSRRTLSEVRMLFGYFVFVCFLCFICVHRFFLNILISD